MKAGEKVSIIRCRDFQEGDYKPPQGHVGS